MGEDACHDSVRHGGGDFTDVLRAFSFSHLDVLRTKVDCMAPELGHGDFEGGSGSERGFFKDHGQGFAFEQLTIFASAFQLTFKLSRELEYFF